jgi:hypothetical protein
MAKKRSFRLLPQPNMWLLSVDVRQRSLKTRVTLVHNSLISRRIRASTSWRYAGRTFMMQKGIVSQVSRTVLSLTSSSTIPSSSCIWHIFREISDFGPINSACPRFVERILLLQSVSLEIRESLVKLLVFNISVFFVLNFVECFVALVVLSSSRFRARNICFG